MCRQNAYHQGNPLITTATYSIKCSRTKSQPFHWWQAGCHITTTYLNRPSVNQQLCLHCRSTCTHTRAQSDQKCRNPGLQIHDKLLPCTPVYEHSFISPDIHDILIDQHHPHICPEPTDESLRGKPKCEHLEETWAPGQGYKGGQYYILDLGGQTFQTCGAPVPPLYEQMQHQLLNRRTMVKKEPWKVH